MNVKVPDGLPGRLAIVDANIETVGLVLIVQSSLRHVQQAKNFDHLFLRQLEERSNVAL
jgi:hypothetical protein